MRRPMRLVTPARAEGIRLALRELGYIEGREHRHRVPICGRESSIGFLSLRPSWCVSKVDLIVVAAGDPWIRAAKNATKSIPIVMTGQGSDPVAAGLVDSLARSRRQRHRPDNSLHRELGGKRLDLFKEAVPKVVRVAVLYDPALRPVSSR